MATLPEDVLRHIFSYVCHPTLLTCRLIDRASGLLATALAFHHVRLEATRSALPFVRISESAGLRDLVREVTVDACPPDPQSKRYDDENQDQLHYTRFLLALPRMRFFSKMRILNLRFPKSSDLRLPPFLLPQADPPLPGLHPSLDACEGMLSTALNCLAGEWTEERQRDWELLLQYTWQKTRDVSGQTRPEDPPGAFSWAKMAEFLPAAEFSQTRMSLSRLTISNVPEILDDGFYASPGFQHLFFVEPPPALKLLIAPRRHDTGELSEATFRPEMYEFFERLPSTWLSPPLASNLRELSLYRHDYFGWVPKLDLRMVNPGSKSGSALPNLRVLALGEFVFTHQWQVDWVASLGRENGRGGLEELYLDNSPIMWRAHTLGPPDESVVDLGGEKLDNIGYPLKEVMTRQSPHDARWDPITVDFDLRWSTVLRTWREKMRSLKVFRMGGGDWGGLSSWLVSEASASDATGEGEAELWARRREDAVHVNYDKPSAKECLERDDPNKSCSRYGVGLGQDREYLLQYAYFNVFSGPTPWIERDFKKCMMDEYEDGWQRYEASRARDEEALKELMDAVASRSEF